MEENKSPNYQPKKGKDDKKEYDFLNEKTRIIQKNLIYLIGLPEKLANEQLLNSEQYMGQYGEIQKVVINEQVYTIKKQEQFSAYITYKQQYSAALAILSLQDYCYDNFQIKAYFGTSKYCSNFLKNIECQNQYCVFQHNIAQVNDNFNISDIKKNQNISSLHINWAIDVLIKKNYDFTSFQPSNNNGFPQLIKAKKYLITIQQTKSLETTPQKKRKNRLINTIDQDKLETGLEVETHQDTLSTKENQESFYVRNQLDDFDLDYWNKSILKYFMQNNCQDKNSKFLFAQNDQQEDKPTLQIKNLIFQYLNQQSIQDLNFDDDMAFSSKNKSNHFDFYF